MKYKLLLTAHCAICLHCIAPEAELAEEAHRIAQALEVAQLSPRSRVVADSQLSALRAILGIALDVSSAPQRRCESSEVRGWVIEGGGAAAGDVAQHDRRRASSDSVLPWDTDVPRRPSVISIGLGEYQPPGRTVPSRVRQTVFPAPSATGSALSADASGMSGETLQSAAPTTVTDAINALEKLLAGKRNDGVRHAVSSVVSLFARSKQPHYCVAVQAFTKHLSNIFNGDRQSRKKARRYMQDVLRRIGTLQALGVRLEFKPGS